MQVSELIQLLKRFPPDSEVWGGSWTIRTMLNIELPDTSMVKAYGDGTVKLHARRESDGQIAREIVEQIHRDRVRRGRKDLVFAETEAHRDNEIVNQQIRKEENRAAWKERQRRRNSPTPEELRTDEALAYEISDVEMAKAERRKENRKRREREDEWEYRKIRVRAKPRRTMVEST